MQTVVLSHHLVSVKGQKTGGGTDHWNTWAFASHHTYRDICLWWNVNFLYRRSRSLWEMLNGARIRVRWVRFLEHQIQEVFTWEHLPDSESEPLHTVQLISDLAFNHDLGPWKVMLNDWRPGDIPSQEALSILLSIQHPPICPTYYLSIHSHIHPIIHTSIHPPILPHTDPPIYLYAFASLYFQWILSLSFILSSLSPFFLPLIFFLLLMLCHHHLSTHIYLPYLYIFMYRSTVFPLDSGIHLLLPDIHTHLRAFVHAVPYTEFPSTFKCLFFILQSQF